MAPQSAALIPARERSAAMARLAATRQLEVEQRRRTAPAAPPTIAEMKRGFRGQFTAAGQAMVTVRGRLLLVRPSLIGVRAPVVAATATATAAGAAASAANDNRAPRAGGGAPPPPATRDASTSSSTRPGGTRGSSGATGYVMAQGIKSAFIHKSMTGLTGAAGSDIKRSLILKVEQQDVVSLDRRLNRQKLAARETGQDFGQRGGTAPSSRSTSAQGPKPVASVGAAVLETRTTGTRSFNGLQGKLLRPDLQSPFQGKDPAYVSKYVSVAQLATLPYTHRDSIWNAEALKRDEHSKLKESLERFHNTTSENSVGKSVRNFDMTGKSVADIRREAEANGFKLLEAPEKRALQATGKDADEGCKNFPAKKCYRLQDGLFTDDPTHPKVALHYIYVHPDGGMIRIKPHGEPRSDGSFSRTAAHVSKSVLLVTPKDAKITNLQLADVSYENEAFKVTNRDIPVPKSSFVEVTRDDIRLDAGGPSGDAHADAAHTNIIARPYLIDN